MICLSKMWSVVCSSGVGLCAVVWISISEDDCTSQTKDLIETLKIDP